MVIRGSGKLPIKQLDTSPIQENFVGARRRNAQQIGPRVVVFNADRVFAHEIQRSLGGWREPTGGSNVTLVMRPCGPTAQQAWSDVQSTAQWAESLRLVQDRPSFPVQSSPFGPATTT